MKRHLIIFMIMVATLVLVPVVAIQTHPSAPVITSVRADDSWGGGSDCDRDSGPQGCTNTIVVGPCGGSIEPGPFQPPCGAGHWACLNGCGDGVCMPMPPSSPAASIPITTTPGSPQVTTSPSCNSVLVQWSGFENTTGCISAANYKVYRREIDASGNPIGAYELIATLGNTGVYVDSSTDPSRAVIPGKRYQYKVEAIPSSVGSTNVTVGVCQLDPNPKESGVVLIPPCASITPAGSTQPAASTITTPTASTASSQRGRYVCRTVTSPNTNGGSQLQLQTLKCEYIN